MFRWCSAKGQYCFFLTNVMFWIKQRLNLLSWVPLCKTAKTKKTSRPALWHRFLFKCTQSLTASSFFLTDRREAVLLPSLQQGIRRQVQPQGSPTDPLGCEKIPMQELLQNLLQDVSSAQAWGIWVLCSTLTELGYFLFSFFPPPSSEKKNKTNCCFFIFSEPGRAVRESHRLGGEGFFLFVFFSASSSASSSSSSTIGRFHFRALWAHVPLASSSVSVIAISVELCHAMYSPTCAIHALFLHV